MRRACFAVCAWLLGLASSVPAAIAADAGWMATWGASPVAASGEHFDDQTIRQFVRISAGGRQVRVRFTNELGAEKLSIGAAHIAMPGAAPGSIDPASDHALRFAGHLGIVVPPGAAALSDPVAMTVPELASLAISLFVAGPTGPAVIHADAEQTAFVSARGDFTARAVLPEAKTTRRRYFLSGVEVSASHQIGAGVLVTLGDSITDGSRSGVDANHRWPDGLADRLAAVEGQPMIGVVNAGIAGNRLLGDSPDGRFGPAALSRLDRDVLDVPGLRWVVVLEGINDIGHAGAVSPPQPPVSAAALIDGLQRIVARAHARGVRVYGATLTPFQGSVIPGYFSPVGEATRQAVNQWIRRAGAFDAVIDFDAALRDPAHPAQLRPDFDSGDHLHPGPAGYQAMANAVDLGLFQ